MAVPVRFRLRVQKNKAKERTSFAFLVIKTKGVRAGSSLARFRLRVQNRKKGVSILGLPVSLFLTPWHSKLYIQTIYLGIGLMCFGCK